MMKISKELQYTCVLYVITDSNNVLYNITV